jgi:DNA-binding response OmpR family regulator
MDELTAMNLGADDFVTKPYNLQILLMRIASVLKRSYKERAQDTLDCGDFSVSLSKSLLICGEKETELTKNELKILSCLCENRGAIVSRDTLMVQLWNSELFVDDNTLTVNINRLRKKLQSAGLKSTIQTKRGQGYLMP